MSRYALIDNGTHKVLNVVEWDGDLNKWSPPVTCSVVQSDAANIGDSYDGTKFTSGPPPPPPIDQADFDAAVALLRNTFNTARTVGQVNNCIDAITVILRRVRQELK